MGLEDVRKWKTFKEILVRGSGPRRASIQHYERLKSIGCGGRCVHVKVFETIFLKRVASRQSPRASLPGPGRLDFHARVKVDP